MNERPVQKSGELSLNVCIWVEAAPMDPAKCHAATTLTRAYIFRQ
jgi:hypothetical protein